MGYILTMPNANPAPTARQQARIAFKRLVLAERDAEIAHIQSQGLGVCAESQLVINEHDRAKARIAAGPAREAAVSL